jgi:hypothetical protein
MPRHCTVFAKRQSAALYVPCDLKTFALHVAGGQLCFALKVLQNSMGTGASGLSG